MSYSPGLSEVVPPMVSPATFGWSNYAHERVAASAAVSGAWESANQAAYMPVLVPTVCVVRRLWWANGSTVSASYNVDCGIYADAGYKPGVKLVSAGSTAQGTASQVQFVDVTDTTLPPGLYWIALSCSSLSATFFRVAITTGVSGDAPFRFTETASVPLPATATPVEATTAFFYLCGFATTASP